MAALVDGGEPVLVVDEELVRSTGADAADIGREKAREWLEIVPRRAADLDGREPVPLQGASAVGVDDGISTGTTMRAALKALRQRGAARPVPAVPVAPHDTVLRLRGEVDQPRAPAGALLHAVDGRGG